MNKTILIIAAWSFLWSACSFKSVPGPSAHKPSAATDLARRDDTVDVLHGVKVPDPYRWLEGKQDEVRAFDERHNQAFFAATGEMAQKKWLNDELQRLWRYDDEEAPRQCLLSPRLIQFRKKKEQDKWVVWLKENPEDKGRVVLDPNSWAETETLDGFYPSPDCRYAAYGVARAGDENPVMRVLDLNNLQLLADTLRGRQQSSAAWLHDNSGFYFSGKPKPGEVPPGQENYWHRVWFHKLGTQAQEDQLFFHDPKVKEHYHDVSISEDGRWLTMSRVSFNASEIWLKDLQKKGDPVPMATGMDHNYQLDIVAGQIIITTDWDAPRYRVMTTTVDKPAKKHWRELIAQSEDRLKYCNPIAGRLYAAYLHRASSRIAVHDLDGHYIQELKLPALGSANVWGHWSKSTVWLYFHSYTQPGSYYTYDGNKNQLKPYWQKPIDIDTAHMLTEQVFYPSKDGTRVSMFLIHDKNATAGSKIPYLLSGYGGFNLTKTPSFKVLFPLWIAAGGGIAIANLRGGGEYGQQWHQAGMREKKQNVFDDFIAAAQWLIKNNYTTSQQLAISGASNGGLLVAAAMAQRPDLFQAVLCRSPLTDMIRYHRLGLANIWAEEYGSAEDPTMFPPLLAYSPYHNLKSGQNYPAALIVGSDNDARTDPAHARKFFAALRWADQDHGAAQPILLHIQRQSGHGGGVSIDARADQKSRHYGFLMQQLGMQAPGQKSQEKSK